MSKIKLTKEQTKIDLDALLKDVSDTDISATKGDGENNNISATKEFSATKDKKFSDTKVSSTKYMNQYKKEHYDTIRFDVPKGTKALLQAESTKRGLSLTKLIMVSLEMYLDNTR